MTFLRKSKGVVLGVLLAATLAIFGLGAQAQSAEPACEGEYLESVRNLGLTYIDGLNAGNLDSWYVLLADDYQAFYPEVDFVPMDKEAALASDEGIMAVFPGFQTVVHFSTVSADCRFVTFHWTSTGNFNGPMGDIQPTGQETSVSGISITEVIDGKITREWVSYDQLTLLSKLGLVTLGATIAEEASSSPEEAHRDALLRIAEDGLTRGTADVLSELIADDYVVHSPFGDLGRDDVRGFFDALRAALTHFEVGRENMVLQGDMAAMRTIVTGVFENDFNGLTSVISPNGQPITLEIVNIFHFNEAGLIDEEWAQFDNLNFLTQLGALPSGE